MPLTTRGDKAQCNVKSHAGWQLTPLICWMKVKCRGAIANARAPKASKIFEHFFCCCGSTPSRSAIKSTTANSSWFAPTMCGRSHTGSNLRQRYSRVGAINNKRSPNTNCSNYTPAPQAGVARKTYLWKTLAKCALPTIQPAVCGVVHWHMRHSTKSRGQPTPRPLCGAESEVAHKWARWLYNPCRLGGPHRFRAGGN